MAKCTWNDGTTLELDRVTGQISNGQFLTGEELKVFNFLWDNREKPWSADEMITKIWNGGTSEVTVRKHIMSIRTKTNSDAIITLPRCGYQLSTYWKEILIVNTNDAARYKEAMSAEINHQSQKCIRILEELSSEGYAPAQNYLGVLLLHGELCPQDRPRGHRLIEEAANAGWVRACFNMGLYRWFGTCGVEKDSEDAVRWFQKADTVAVTEENRQEIEEDVGLAYYYLYLAYYNGEGTAKDFAKAEQYRRKAAICGVTNQETFGVDKGY